MAPNPKPPGQRQRRNLDQSDWTTLSASDVVAEAPKWPEKKRPAAALRYWTAIWASPMSRQYEPTDHFAIVRICLIHADVVAGKASTSEKGELRQLEQLYGLSPKARRSLQWEIERAAGPGTAHTHQPADDERAARAAKRRAELSVVASDS